MSQRATPAPSSPEPQLLGKKISKEDEERLTDSLYRQSLERKKKSLESIEASVYKYAPPNVITREHAEESANRQCTEEVERRKKKHEELVAKHHHVDDGKVISNDDLQSIIMRNYEDAMRIKKDKMEILQQKQRNIEKKQAGNAGKKTALTKEEMASCGERLSRPSKRTYTLDEINRLSVYKTS
jgi:hypothetical protein